MVRKDNFFWVFPILFVVGFLIVYLAINVLSGAEWNTIKLELWDWIPYLLSFSIGFIVLKSLVRRKKR